MFLLTAAMTTSVGQAFAQATHLNIGLVDRDKVVTSYPRAQQAAEELKRQENKVHKLIEDSNKNFERIPILYHFTAISEASKSIFAFLIDNICDGSEVMIWSSV